MVKYSNTCTNNNFSEGKKMQTGHHNLSEEKTLDTIVSPYLQSMLTENNICA